MGKIIKNKFKVITAIVFILVVSIIFSLIYFSKPTSAADPYCTYVGTTGETYVWTSGYLSVTLSGPAGTGYYRIDVTTTNSKNKVRNDFVDAASYYVMTIVHEAGTNYNLQFSNGASQIGVLSTKDGGTFRIINYSLRYQMPAHTNSWSVGTNVANYGGATPDGRFIISADTSSPHSDTAEWKYVDCEVNIIHIGIITPNTNKHVRWSGSKVNINMARSSIEVFYRNGYGGGWVSLGTKSCGNTLSNLPNVSRQYYDFAGWKDEHGHDIDRGSVVCTDDDWFKWVTAQWTHRTTEVTFYPEGGSGNMGIQTVNLGERTALKANTFTRETYKFIGWTLDPESRKVNYPDKQSITLTDENGLELYAVWQKEDTGFDTQEVIEDAEMFGADGELEGGAGTVFDRNRTDSRFAHIDGGESDPAYFTKK